MGSHEWIIGNGLWYAVWTSYMKKMCENTSYRNPNMDVEKLCLPLWKCRSEHCWILRLWNGLRNYVNWLWRWDNDSNFGFSIMSFPLNGSLMTDWNGFGATPTEWVKKQIDGLMQEKCNSVANALELRLSCTNPSKWWFCVILHAGWPASPIASGPLFTKKTPSYGYRDPHDKPKTVWRPSQVYNRNPYTDKTASI